MIALAPPRTTTYTRSFLLSATAGAGLDSLTAAGPVFRASAYGFSSTATAAVNSAAIQSAYTAAAAAGRGTVVIKGDGTCQVALQANPYQAGTSCLWDIASDNIRTILENGTTLFLANGQQTGSTNYAFGWVFRDRNRLKFEGDGTLDLNSQGQTGWTGGYEQQRGGHINGYATEAGGGIDDITVEYLTLLNTFGNPINLGNLGNSNQAINTRCFIRHTRSRVFGEGIQIIGANDFEFDDNTVDDSGGTARGDWIESSNSLNGVVRFNRLIGNGTNTLAGSGYDMVGSKKVSVIGNIMNGVNDCFGMGNGLGAVIVDEITIAGNVLTGCRAGTINGDGKVTYSGNHWKGIVAAGYCVQTTGTVATSRIKFTGDTFDGCASNTHSGSRITTYTGCDILNGTSHGITLSRDGSGNIPTVRMYGGSINGCVGAGVATSSDGTAFSPVFFRRGTHLTGNTGGEVAHFGNGNAAAFDSVL